MPLNFHNIIVDLWTIKILNVVLGMDKTIQRGDMDDHGLLFKIIPKHNDPGPSKKFVRSCWVRKVPSWDPIQGQTVVPTNLSEFKVRGLSLRCF